MTSGFLHGVDHVTLVTYDLGRVAHKHQLLQVGGGVDVRERGHLQGLEQQPSAPGPPAV